MNENSTLYQPTEGVGSLTASPSTSRLIAARIIELVELKNIIQKRIDELKKASVGVENLGVLTGKKPESTTTKLNELPWKPSKYPENNPQGEYIKASEVPAWVENITFPIEDGGFKYFKSKNGNLTRYIVKAK